MIRLVLFSIVLMGAVIDPTRVSKINALKEEAKTAYNKGDYKTAVEKYKELNEKYGVKEDEVQLNLANGYLLSKDTANAMTTFQPLTNSTNKEIASKAHQQLGIIASQQKKYDQALSDFKQAIKTNPNNESARYNYELLKRRLEENQKNQNQKDKNNKKDSQNNKQQEPSAFAKKLKQQADALVSTREYKKAHDLMTDGLKKDPSVSYYDEYIKRIKDVVDINR